MNNKLITFILLISSPFVLMLLHILLVRITKTLKLNISYQYSLFLITLFFNLPLLATVYALNKTLESLVYCFIVYNLIGYCHFNIFNMGETARRIKILLEIMQRKSILKEDLKKYYLFDKMVENRLKRLIDLKQIKQQENRYFLSGKILLGWAIFMYFWRNLLDLNDNSLKKELGS